MECERCKKAEATIHLTEIIKDVKSELHLCEACARDVGLNAKLSNFSLSVPEMLSFLDLNEVDQTADELRCKICNYTFIDYNKTGKLGCPDCYQSFAEPMKSIVSSYHGEQRHIGKLPLYTIDSIKEPARVARVPEIKDSISDLQRQLEYALDEERYEDAAVLRDRLKEINED